MSVLQVQSWFSLLLVGFGYTCWRRLHVLLGSYARPFLVTVFLHIQAFLLLATWLLLACHTLLNHTGVALFAGVPLSLVCMHLAGFSSAWPKNIERAAILCGWLAAAVALVGIAREILTDFVGALWSLVLAGQLAASATCFSLILFAGLWLIVVVGEQFDVPREILGRLFRGELIEIKSSATVPAAPPGVDAS